MIHETVASPVPDAPLAPYKKKLIEVALPLPAINAASAREKSLRHGHPSTLHLWWARRPLAACRAVLFASLVDDPSEHAERFPTVAEQDAERSRLFTLIERLVKWENSNNATLLEEARGEIRNSVGEHLPAVYDPFCGGGAIPIESQRLGLPTLASDSNPVAVLITKALTEIPWRFRERAPVHPSLQGPLNRRTWRGAAGLAADVEHYGSEVFEAARAALAPLYPSVVTPLGRATAIAWLWARTVMCPNPLCGAVMPLIKSFGVCTRPGKEWSIEPVVDRDAKAVRFETRPGKPSRGGTVNRRGAICIVCEEPVSIAYIRTEGKAKRMGARMLAIVADGERGRAYVAPEEQDKRIADSARPRTLETQIVRNPRYMSPPLYGMTTFGDLFTERQLLAMTTLSDLIREVRPRIEADAKAAGFNDADSDLEAGGEGARAYATAITTYLTLALDRLADYCSNLCIWNAPREQIGHVFGRQTLSMTWDFAEVNPFSNSSGNFGGAVEWVRKCVLAASPNAEARAFVADATTPPSSQPVVYATDPPYYDNVPYADLSDFFYVWLRATLGDLHPETLATLLVPKATELVADPARFGNDAARAREFFESGLRRAFAIMRQRLTPAYPATIFYAFKQTEHHDEGAERDLSARVSIGWETMLAAVLDAGFTITGTWPLTSERPSRLRSIDSNALASSIVLVCRPRPADAPTCGRADFLRELRAGLPKAVERLRDASLAATDLQQAALGPGMAIFSAYGAVLEADDRPMSVRSALALITAELGNILLGELADVDAETHFALAWFADHSYEAGKAGQADVVLRSKNATPGRLQDAGVLVHERGLTQLRSPQQLATLPLPSHFALASAWTQTLFLVAALVGTDGGEQRAADVLRLIGAANADRVKSVAYHLYLVCDARKRATEARDFNALIVAWPTIERLATNRQPEQGTLT